ncbi:hypothetical protein NDU88_003563 [Pleurodeles waltl]|uniref:Integrase catalytic domain-containing protein n=1 Tax=Pleurodeles waltl TaxID=8319 RepID=A0AAV7N0H7_PLEWA|nr:hypothetical protein NDU88_003563 [Pleurodeles waltl]
MATHGLIAEIKTDIGPPFQSQELAGYFESAGVRHRRITLRWPQANGEVERFMRRLNKVIRIPHASGQPSEYAVYSFLRNYRQTPPIPQRVEPQGMWFLGKRWLTQYHTIDPGSPTLLIFIKSRSDGLSPIDRPVVGCGLDHRISK